MIPPLEGGLLLLLVLCCHSESHFVSAFVSTHCNGKIFYISDQKLVMKLIGGIAGILLFFSHIIYFNVSVPTSSLFFFFFFF